MFNKVLRSTPMTTQEAEDYFSERIIGESVNGDATFVSTLRALIDPRLPDDELLSFSFGRSNYTKGNVESWSDSNAIRNICDIYASMRNSIHVHNFCNIQEEGANDAWMDLFEKKFEKVYEGFHKVEKVTTFYRNVFRALCFINPERKTTMLFVNLSTATTPLDIRRFHYLQCGIFAFLPWYFDPSQGVTDLEKELVNSLRLKTETEYLACLQKFADAYDFDTQRINKLLSGFEIRFERMRLDEVNRNISNIRRSMQALNEQFAECLKQQREAEALAMGLEMKIASGSEESEIRDYFLVNKQLSLKNVNNMEMDFVVRSTLSYFDEEMAERFLDNPSSYFYQYAERDGEILDRDNLKMLLREIFIEQRLKVQFCAAYKFRLNGNVRPIGRYPFGAECGNYTPNPHIDQYECLGNYERIINGRLAEHDYIGALEQCIASCKSLNLADGTVLREFMKRLVGESERDANRKCIVLPDGNIVIPEDAVRWLLLEKEQKEAENNG